jgi:hypothetical protein
MEDDSPDRTRRIVRAIRRGEAVADPRDASLAIEVIDRRAALDAVSAGWWKKFDRLADVLMLVALLSLALLTHSVAIVALASLPELLYIATRLFTRRTEAQLAASRAKNEQLIEAGP